MNDHNITIGDTINNPAFETKMVSPIGKESLLSFWRLLKTALLKGKTFYRENFEKKSERFLYVIIWITGVVNYIDFYVDNSSVKDAITNWESLWTRGIVFGIFWGLSAYCLGGILFHGAVKLSGGTGTFRLSKKVYIYSLLPVSIATLFVYVCKTIFYGNKYFEGYGNENMDIAFGLLWVTAFALAIILLFYGAKLVLHTKPVKSVLVFVILPIVLLCFYIGADYNKQNEFMTNKINLAVNEVEKGDYDKAEYLFEELLQDNDVDQTTKTGILNVLNYLHEKKADSKNALKDKANI